MEEDEITPPVNEPSEIVTPSADNVNEPSDPANPSSDPANPSADNVNEPSEPTEPKKLKSLLDDDDETPDNEPTDPAQPSAEDIDAWVKSVPALDLGDGVTWDDAALKAMAPSLMSLEKDKADKVIKAYADYTKGIAKAQAEAADAFNNGLIAECKKRFGEDLKKVTTLAKQGGVAVFGEKIWNEMKSVPAFANNPDIIERLANIARKFATDGGKVASDGAGGGSDNDDLLKRMYGKIKV
jgi:hypothetical protein